jgi:hypothetical protein
MNGTTFTIVCVCLALVIGLLIGLLRRARAEIKKNRPKKRLNNFEKE